MMANTDTSQMIITGILATDNETRSSFVEVSNHQEFQVPKVQVLNLKKTILVGGCFPLHKLFPYSFYRWYGGTDSSISGTNEIFGRIQPSFGVDPLF